MLGWLTPSPGLGFTGFLPPDGMHKFLVEVGDGKAQAVGLGSNEVSPPQALQKLPLLRCHLLQVFCTCNSTL